MKALLDKIPFNGYKRWIGIGAIVVILGCMSAGYLDQQTGEILLGMAAAWTGVAIKHSDMKRTAGE